ncbi:MAG TPA: alpha/beta hydrolase-fold protein, partial [Gemmatimonadaceae bacterium]|nr:alpha/beta hydrolase-fold protein [Gemmatimonadaceae bacterium]
MRLPFRVLAAVAAAALAAGVVVAAGEEPDRHGARLVTFTVRSELVSRNLTARAVVPAGVGDGERRPLLVFLHGRGGRPGDVFGANFYGQLRELGDRAPVVVAFDGGDHSYWHDRRSGRWGSYVMREALPEALRRLPADPRRVAIGGISMGGFGALDLARLHPRRFCAVGGHSAALWLRSGDSAPGAFDGVADYARHDVLGYVRRRAHPYAGIPIWLDHGRSDPFVPANQALVRALRRRGADVTHRVYAGAHTGAYWRRHIDEYLRF